VIKQLKIKKLDEKAIIPQYATKGSVAFDIHSIEDAIIGPQRMVMIHTGIAVQLPKDHEMTVRQRSGMSLVYPNYIAISIGTIDEDYRGEITVPIYNHYNFKHIEIKEGDRIAQCVVSPITRVKFKLVKKLDDTARGTGGFGHTGRSIT
jgi:dUTP pyrophosphatase